MLVAAACVLLCLTGAWAIHRLVFAAGDGDLIVRIDDPSIEARYKNGVLKLYDPDNNLLFTLKPGEREKKIPPGPYKIKVTNAEGVTTDQTEFTMKEGGKVVVHVALKPPAVVPGGEKPDLIADPLAGANRRAAEWVLSRGGSVTVRQGKKELHINKKAALPEEPFQVTSISLRSVIIQPGELKNLQGLTELESADLSNTGRGVTELEFLRDSKKLRNLDIEDCWLNDASLAALSSLSGLENLSLKNLGITDDGLAHIKNLSKLKVLDLTSTALRGPGLINLKDLTNLISLKLTFDPAKSKVDAAAISHLKNLTKLQYLVLHGTHMGDAALIHLAGMTALRDLWFGHANLRGSGLAHLSRMRELNTLCLGGNRIEDKHLAHLAPLTQLSKLEIGLNPVGDAGLAHIKDLSLTELDLGESRITTVGLKNLQAMRALTRLSLRDTRVTDAALDVLLEFPKLSYLNILDARISAKGADDLKAALPRTQVIWGERNYVTATQILAARGSLHIRVQGEKDERSLKPGAVLPRDYFRVTRADMSSCKRPAEFALLRLVDPEFDALESLDLSNTPTDGDTLREIAVLSSLKELNLAATKVDDDALAHLVPLKNLRKLVLDRAPITGKGLRHLKDLPALENLSLACPTLTDIAGRQFASLAQLTRLSLAGSKVGDAILPHLAGLTKLKDLDLTDCAVTDEAIKHLRKMPHLQTIVLMGTKVSEAGIAEIQKGLPLTKIEKK